MPIWCRECEDGHARDPPHHRHGADTQGAGDRRAHRRDAERVVQRRSPVSVTAPCWRSALSAPSAVPSSSPSGSATWWRSGTGCASRYGAARPTRKEQGTSAVPRGYRLRHVEAVQTWLAAAEINRGPVFRPVLKGSRLQSEPLSDRSVAKIVKHYTGLAGSRSGAIRRAQPSRGLHHIGSGKRCGSSAHCRPVATQEHRYAARLRAASAHVQGPRRCGVPVTEPLSA